MAPRRAAASLLLLLCCASPRRIYVHPVGERDVTGVSFLAFARSDVRGFFDPAGRPCKPFSGRVRESFAGWWADGDDPACIHDTFDAGIEPATLELRWRGTVPADGTYNVLSAGYAVGSWGTALARGSYYGDYWAWARVIVDVESAHCRGKWSLDLATAKITGLDARTASFSGWAEIPDIRVADCKGGDALEVRVRLVGQSNRGHIAVDGFGFWVTSDEELNRMFGMRSAPPAPARAARAAAWSSEGAPEDRMRARQMLKSAGCGKCHDSSVSADNSRALAVYDLVNADWAARMSDAQLPRLLLRLKSAPKADQKVVRDFIVAELQRRARRGPMNVGNR